MFVILASRDPVLRFHGSVTLKKQASDVFRRSVIIRYVESDGVKVHETWESEHNDQANTSHVYPSTNVGQICQSWKHEMIIIHMTPCTMQNNWHTRQINHSW